MYGVPGRLDGWFEFVIRRQGACQVIGKDRCGCGQHLFIHGQAERVRGIGKPAGRQKIQAPRFVDFGFAGWIGLSCQGIKVLGHVPPLGFDRQDCHRQTLFAGQVGFGFGELFPGCGHDAIHERGVGTGGVQGLAERG